LKIKDKKDFASGLMFIAFGAFFAILARGYQMGTAAKMGAGYFPFWLGVLLALIGVIVLLKSLSANNEEHELGKWDWKTIMWVTGSVVHFAVILQYIGLILSIIVLVFISALASHEFNWKQTIVSASIVLGISYGAFIWGLKLQFPVWPPFLMN
jgi:hypothetical protein